MEIIGRSIKINWKLGKYKSKKKWKTNFEILSVKWQGAANQGVKNNSQRPHIYLRSFVFLSLKNVRIEKKWNTKLDKTE